MKVFIPKNSKLDVLSTYGSLNTLLRIFNLSCISRDGNSLKWSWPIWKISLIMTIVFVLNGLTVYIKIVNSIAEHKTHPFKEALQIVYLIGNQQYLVDMGLVYKFGRQEYVDYLKLYEQFDSMLGTFYYKKLKTSIRNLCYSFTAIGIVSVVADYVGWSVGFGFIAPIVYVIDYLYVIVKMLSILDMISNYMQMWYRVKAVADTLEDYYCRCENLPGIVKEVTNIKLSKLIQLDGFNSVKFNKMHVIMDLPRLYLILIEQCEYLNMKYGLRYFAYACYGVHFATFIPPFVIVDSVTFLLDMVMMMNLLIRLAMGTMVTLQNNGSVPMILAAVRIISSTIVFVTFIYRCEQSYRQNERILRLVDHLILLKRIPFEVRDNLKELKSLLLTKAVRYHAMNFYKLEYATLVSISSVIVTYTIILLQNIK